MLFKQRKRVWDFSSEIVWDFYIQPWRIRHVDSLHVLYAVNQSDVVRNIIVCSPDTEIFILLLDIFSRNSIAGELIFKPGKGKFARKISIKESCKRIGTKKAMGLLGLHIFSGWLGGRLCGKSKKKWITSYLALEANLDVLQQLWDNELGVPWNQKVPESFFAPIIHPAHARYPLLTWKEICYVK